MGPRPVICIVRELYHTGRGPMLPRYFRRSERRQFATSCDYVKRNQTFDLMKCQTSRNQTTPSGFLPHLIFAWTPVNG